MGTITKALSLLNQFSRQRPEIGLIEMTKITGRDKATVHRHLSELTENGFLEQNAVSRLYRLGPAILRLASVRETNHPIRRILRPIVEEAAETIGELAHFSLLQGDILSPVFHHEPHWAFLDLGMVECQGERGRAFARAPVRNEDVQDGLCGRQPCPDSKRLKHAFRSNRQSIPPPVEIPGGASGGWLRLDKAYAKPGLGQCQRHRRAIQAATHDQDIVVKRHGPNMGVFAPLSMRPTDATVRKTGV